MKQFTMIIMMLLAGLSALAGCTVQEIESAAGTGDHIRFSASIVATRTSIEGFEVKWLTNDRVRIIDSEGHDAIYSVVEGGSTSASLVYYSGADLSSGPGVVYKAYFPTDINSGSFKETRANIYHPMIATSEPGSTSLSFANICGLIDVSITSDLPNRQVNRVTISADQPMSGPYALKDGKALISEGSGKADWSIPLTRLLSPEKTDIYIAVPENDYTGVTVVVGCSDGSTQTFTASGVKKVETGKITTFDITANNLYKDLGAEGTANCYIAPEAGAYKFMATVKGNDAGATIAPVSVGSLWETFGTDTAPEVGDIIRNVRLADGYVYFERDKAGNAAIAAYAGAGCGGDILWSWHIWCPETPVDEFNFSDGYTLMDRDLGARTAKVRDVSSLGLLYEWGRKDPFRGSSALNSAKVAASSVEWPAAVETSVETGTVDYAVKNPMQYIICNTAQNMVGNTNYKNWLWETTNWAIRNTLWGDSSASEAKTIYDPCPPGYRVASEIAYGKAMDTPDWSQWNTGYVSTLEGHASWFPSNGYISPAGVLVSNGNIYSGWADQPMSGSNAVNVFINKGAATPLFSLHHPTVRTNGMGVRCMREPVNIGKPAIDAENPNITYEGTLHMTLSDGKAIINRIDAALLADPDFYLSSLNANTQSGVRILFRTDSQTITPVFSLRSGGRQLDGTFYYGIYCDGCFLRDVPGVSPTFSAPSAGEHDYCIVLPIMYCVDFDGLVLDEGSSLSKVQTDPKPIYVSIGDSITHGTGQRNRGSEATYAYTLAETKGWYLYNLAVGGSKTSPRIAEELTGLNVSVITVLWGFNDWNLWLGDTDNIGGRYKDLLDRLVEVQPSADIWCILPTTAKVESKTTDANGNPYKGTLQDVRDAERAVITAKMATPEGAHVHLIDGSTLNTVSDLYDNVHLSNDGAAKVAAALATLIN